MSVYRKIFDAFTKNLRVFFKKYSDADMMALGKAYFNQGAKSKEFAQLEKYALQKNGRRPKTFLYTYQNQFGSQFGLFIPTDLENNPEKTEENAPFSITLTFLIDFLKDHLQTRPKETEFFLVPLMDRINGHWTALRIEISANNELKIKHYDPSIIKKDDIESLLERRFREAFQDNLKKIKFAKIREQADSVNCGPFTHKIIKRLAKNEEPNLLVRPALRFREKDIKLLEAALQLQKKSRHDDPNQPFNELNFYKVPEMPFLVKHRRTLVYTSLVLALAISVGLLVLFPPAGLASLITSAAVAAGTSALGIAGIASGITTFIGAAVGLLAKAALVFKRSRNKAPEFSYDETKFKLKTVHGKPSAMQPILSATDSKPVEESEFDLVESHESDNLLRKRSSTKPAEKKDTHEPVRPRFDRRSSL